MICPKFSVFFIQLRKIHLSLCHCTPSPDFPRASSFLLLELVSSMLTDMLPFIWMVEKTSFKGKTEIKVVKMKDKWKPEIIVSWFFSKWEKKSKEETRCACQHVGCSPPLLCKKCPDLRKSSTAKKITFFQGQNIGTCPKRSSCVTYMPKINDRP